MAKRILLILTLALFAGIGTRAGQPEQTNFTGLIVPKYMASGAVGRIPVVFRATLSNLSANSQYRCFVRGGNFQDARGGGAGAGDAVLHGFDTTRFHYTAAPSLTTPGTFSVFRTDASGSYTGWFSFVGNDDARFAAGKYVIPIITVGDSLGTELAKRPLDDSLMVLEFNANGRETSGTAIWGKSGGHPRNIVLLYDNLAGSGKPLAATYLENDGMTIPGAAAFYADSVEGRDRGWGTIIPNVNKNGVRRIEQKSLRDASLVGYQTNPTGKWGTARSTVNPDGGLTAIGIDSLSASLPVDLVSFDVALVKNKVTLTWVTDTELRNLGFELERKTVSGEFELLAFVSGSSRVSRAITYSFVDMHPPHGWILYRLKLINFDGSYFLSDPVSIDLGEEPQDFVMDQNSPEPANPNTTINVVLMEAGEVSLKIYNEEGKVVRTLVSGLQFAGNKNYDWDGTDDYGRPVPAHVYYYRFSTPKYSQAKKMTLVR